ncbi:MAG: DUF6599 family protein [Acidobacteriota bacterium]
MLNSYQSKMAVVLLALVSACALAGCKKASDPFPASGAVAGWQKSSATRTFAARDLWQYIDGEAEAYIRAGVISASTSDYKYQGQLEATVDVYTMGAASGAGAILDKQSTRDAQAVALGDAGIAFEQSVLFRKGPRFVRIVAYEATPQTQQALLALAHGVEARL